MTPCPRIALVLLTVLTGCGGPPKVDTGAIYDQGFEKGYTAATADVQAQIDQLRGEMQAQIDALELADAAIEEGLATCLTADDADIAYITPETAASTYVTQTAADARYQPAGSYLDEATASALYQPLGTYLTDAQAAALYQPLGAYLTDAQAAALYQPIGTYLTESQAGALYQPIGEYVDVGELSQYVTLAYADATYLTEASADALYQPIGDYLTPAGAEALYQPAGDYASSGELSLYATLAYADDAVAAEASARATSDDELATRLSTIEADYLVAADVSDVVRLITTDTTWTIDQNGTGDYATVDQAIAALDSYRIASDATVTIQLEAGRYDFTEALTFHHPDGGRVRLVGDTSAPVNVNLYFVGSSGIVVDEGSTLGYLGGLSLHGDGSASFLSGLEVVDGSAATIGPLLVDDFGGHGVYVHAASSLVRDSLPESGTEELGWLTVTNSRTHGVVVATGSYADLERLVSDGSDGYGVEVSYGSALYANYAVSSSSGGAGFHVHQHSLGYFNDSVAFDNGTDGYAAEVGATLTAMRGVAHDNRDDGFLAIHGSVISADYAASYGHPDVDFEARQASYISAYDSDAGRAGATSAYGYYAAESSYVYAQWATATGHSVAASTSSPSEFAYVSGI